MKRSWLPIIIGVVLFFLPFFWLNPGEMDLGGDSSRLYFYDPLSYLTKNMLYSVSASSYGLETIYYYALPFTAMLALLRQILSSTILISVFHGTNASMAFVFVYLIIYELLKSEQEIDRVRAMYASVAGGLLYILSPALIDGWQYVLLTRSQVFLNPVMFYIFLKYTKTTNFLYIIIALLISVLFSPNFSIVAAPALFAFYPLSIGFLFFYTKFIQKRRMNGKQLFVGFFLVLVIHGFHIFPQVGSLFSKESDIHSTVFSNESKFGRGLSYFSAIAPSIKISTNLLGFPQMKDVGRLSSVFMIFPIIIFLSFLIKKNRTIILTSMFFIIALFFATANITNVGLSFYKSLFALPGFAMFRNYYGQWQFVYIFFYTILFGQAVYVVLGRLALYKRYVLLGFVIFICIANARLFLTGELMRRPLWQSNDVKPILVMDTDYEALLSFVRDLPADARILTLPLTDPGYQIIAGKNNGAYVGPSTIAYLAGKKDFAGYEEFIQYKDSILRLVRGGQFEELKKLLGMLNVKYIFYNADTLVYNEFPGFPYLHVRKFLPKDQKEYAALVKQLHVKEIKNIGNKFYVYELPDEYYLPQVYVAKKLLHYNKPFIDILTPLSLDLKEKRIAIDNTYETFRKGSEGQFDEVLTDIQDEHPGVDFFSSAADFPFGFPFSAWRMNSVIYPIVIWRENRQLTKIKQVTDVYINTSIFLAKKRIAELVRWGPDMPIMGNREKIEELSWQEPSMLDLFTKKNTYDFWEISMLRYQRAIYELIAFIETPNTSKYSSNANKAKVKNAVEFDRKLLYAIVQNNGNMPREKRAYLLRLITGVFEATLKRIDVDFPNPEHVTYSLGDFENGIYDLFLDKKSLELADQAQWRLRIGEQTLLSTDFEIDGEWLKAKNIRVEGDDSQSLVLESAQSEHAYQSNDWISLEKMHKGESFANLSIDYSRLSNKTGLIKEIAHVGPPSFYVLSFEYATHGKVFDLVVYDKRKGEAGEEDRLVNGRENLLHSNEWNTYSTIVASADDTISTVLQITKSTSNDLLDSISSQEKDSSIDVRNFSIIHIPNPRIILRKVEKNQSEDALMPTVTFKRINPTRYEVNIKDATAPYTLVFMNAFNKNWKLVDPTSETNTIRAMFSRIFASIGSAVVGMIEKDGVRGEQMLLQYFGGYVQEAVGKDVFLSRATFESWGKNEVAESKHFSVNGYGNAWYIEPSDVGERAEYRLILELRTQKILYASLVVSFVFLTICVSLLVRALFKK